MGRNLARNLAGDGVVACTTDSAERKQAAWERRKATVCIPYSARQPILWVRNRRLA